jgi:SAM-dependent methyltransferase
VARRLAAAAGSTREMAGFGAPARAHQRLSLNRKLRAMLRFRKFLPRIVYWYVSRRDHRADVVFMNYGYADPAQAVDLHPEEEPNRYSIQLYHHMTANVDFRDKDVVEVGSGRGGGLSFLARHRIPGSAKGIDLCKEAVRFCNSHYPAGGLSFLHGDAQNLPLADESCDILINVESSHRYGDFEKFVSEVHRVLRKGGLFLFSDYRKKRKLPDLRMALEAVPLKVVREECINRQVASALRLDWDRKGQVYKRLVPRFMHGIGLNYASGIQSKLIEKFDTGQKIYFNYTLQKQIG